jgi:hypothetical protein
MLPRADKDEGPAPPFNLLVLLVHTLFALMRQLPLTRRFAPAESTDTKHHHFTVFSGVVATAQSAVSATTRAARPPRPPRPPRARHTAGAAHPPRTRRAPAAQP